jgi:hypothetical protein
MTRVFAHSRGSVAEAYAADPQISARARARGLETVEDLKLAVLKQRATWWQGHSYHCPLCDVDFSDARRAAEHVVLEQHPVLCMDDVALRTLDTGTPPALD